MKNKIFVINNQKEESLILSILNNEPNINWRNKTISFIPSKSTSFYDFPYLLLLKNNILTYSNQWDILSNHNKKVTDTTSFIRKFKIQKLNQ